jgi:hypothetical protein
MDPEGLKKKPLSFFITGLLKKMIKIFLRIDWSVKKSIRSNAFYSI